MLRRRIVVGTIVVFMLIMAIGAMGSAQSRIGVIDLAVVIDESKAGKEGNTILQDALAERQAQVREMEDELLAMEEALSADTLTDDERAERLAELEQAETEYSETVARFEAEIDQLLQTLRRQIISDIGVVVQLVAEERGFDLVIDADQAYYYRRVADLTFEVIREYDDLFDAARSAEAEEEASAQP